MIHFFKTTDIFVVYESKLIKSIVNVANVRLELQYRIRRNLQ